MGGSSSHSVSETIKKNQEYISDMNKIKVRDNRLIVWLDVSKILIMRKSIPFDLFDKLML